MTLAISFYRCVHMWIWMGKRRRRRKRYDIDRSIYIVLFLHCCCCCGWMHVLNFTWKSWTYTHSQSKLANGAWALCELYIFIKMAFFIRFVSRKVPNWLYFVCGMSSFLFSNNKILPVNLLHRFLPLSLPLSLNSKRVSQSVSQSVVITYDCYLYQMCHRIRVIWHRIFYR